MVDVKQRTKRTALSLDRRNLILFRDSAEREREPQMLEEICRRALYQQCNAIVRAEHPIVRLKGSTEPEREFDNFMSWDSGYHTWDGALVRRRVDKRAGDVLYLAWDWFEAHADGICTGFLRDQYKGDLRAAMRECGTFDRLFTSFTDFFAERRRLFVGETNAMIETLKVSIANMGKAPQSHGGVANLLKVLTKTMRDQGSSIRAIAKVQYYVCIQAGIYIPEEFITDVLVGANIEGDNANGNDNH